MKYDLHKVEIVYEIDDEEYEESFSNATEALDYIKETQKEEKESNIELSDDDFDIYITMKEKGFVNSASAEPLDYDDAHISLSTLKDIADDEPNLSRNQKQTMRRKL